MLLAVRLRGFAPVGHVHPPRTSGGESRRAMTAYYQHMGWGMYASDQDWDRIQHTEHGWTRRQRPVPLIARVSARQVVG